MTYLKVVYTYVYTVHTSWHIYQNDVSLEPATYHTLQLPRFWKFKPSFVRSAAYITPRAKEPGTRRAGLLSSL